MPTLLMTATDVICLQSRFAILGRVDLQPHCRPGIYLLQLLCRFLLQL